MKVKLAFGYVCLLLLLTACSGQDKGASDDQFIIYTSIYPIQYVAEEIAGEDALVKSIYPPGVDAHTYEPTSKEITEIASGEAFIYLGEGMESFAESAADALQSQNILFIELGTHTELFKDNESDSQHDGHEHRDADPHIWLDPLRMIKVGEIIKDELSELNPETAETYQNNFDSFKENMNALDKEFTDTLQTKNNKRILVNHAAYGYWEDRYGIEQISISGLSSSDEPSQKELATIARLADEENINYIIFEQTGSNRLATIIQEHIHAKKLTIHNLEVLTEEDIAKQEDYVSLMKNNLQVLDQATD